MSQPLGVGVIGLGRRWRTRYRPALLALRDRFRVRAVYDQIAEYAALQARRLGCASHDSARAVVESDPVEVLLLPDAQWFGLWPVELACRAGKPVFCAAPLGLGEPHADQILEQVRRARLPVLMALTPALAPVTARLTGLLDGPLGPARLLLCDVTDPQDPSPAPDPALLDWCAGLLGAEPVGVRALAGAAGLTSLQLDFPGGRTAQVSIWHAPHARRAVRLRVVADAGTAQVVLPDQLSWADETGRHSHALPPAAVEASLLERFHDDVRANRPPAPDFGRAHQVLTWLRAAERSLAEGRPLSLAAAG